MHLVINVWLVPMYPSTTHLIEMSIDVGGVSSSTDPVPGLEEQNLIP
jgi:hypothetical protein